MKKIVRYFLKFIGYIICGLLLIIINPITVSLLKRISYLFLSLYYSLYLRGKISGVTSHGFIHLTGKKYLNVDKNVRFGRNCKIDCISIKSNHPKLDIGKNVFIMNNVHIGCLNEVSIGEDTLIGSNVLIEDHSHGNINELLSENPKKNNNLYSKGKINIGKNVWICDGVIILPGVTIGDNSVVGAGSIVTKDIPSNSIYAGNPAKYIKGEI